MWREAWAKASRVDDGERPAWLSLVAHLHDSAAVAERLWDGWLGPGPIGLLERDLGDDARLIAIAAAALHDIGKLTPAFAIQVPDLSQHMEEAGYRFGSAADPSDARIVPHSLAGHVIVQEWLVANGVGHAQASAFATVIGGHHGVPPSAGTVGDASVRRSLLGEGVWARARAALIADVVESKGLAGLFEALRRRSLTAPAQSVLTGLVIVADWIASNADLFPLSPRFSQPSESSTVRADRAWRILALPEPWAPGEQILVGAPNKLLEERFGLVGASVRPVQEVAVHAARETLTPGLMIIEASTGSGKTEASLLVAEVFARRFGRSGVFYGLPTRATADAMFDRVRAWWQRVPDASGHLTHSLALRHSTASLQTSFRQLPRRSRGGGQPVEADSDGSVLPASGIADVGRDEIATTATGRALPNEVIAHYWTTGRKKAALSDAVVATIDHELMAALRARHVVLRHLGLARQVVVLDEVHAADAWMREYLHRSLEWLGALGVPVVALSATLPPDQRRDLVHAYERGRRTTQARSEPASPLALLRGAAPPAEPPMPDVPESMATPLVTAVSDGNVRQWDVPSPHERPVVLDWLSDDVDATASAIADIVDAGGCALVVCNTVTRARDRYAQLSDRFGDRVTLAHSRFIARDRARKDEWLRQTFGPPRSCDVQARRGRVVVATQVAEQSLDIDFDILVTDLAPIDVLIQRIGRLHRHARETRPAGAQSARCLVVGIEVGDIPVLEKGGVHVYTAHLLLRAAALLNELIEARRPVALPHDVPILVARAYGADPIGPDQWQQPMAEAADEFERVLAQLRRAADTYRLPEPRSGDSVLGWFERSVGEASDESSSAAGVREPDGGFDVILVQQFDDGLGLPAHLEDPRRLLTDTALAPEVSRSLASCSVRIPGWVTRNPKETEAIFADFDRTYFAAWQKDPLLGGQLLLPLDTAGRGRFGPFEVNYNACTGLEVSRA